VFKWLYLYRHKSTLDVDIRILDIIHEDENKVVLRIAYFHRHFKHYFCDPKNRNEIYSEKVTIPRDRFHLWEEVNEAEVA
jgi:hypothetical protein